MSLQVQTTAIQEYWRKEDVKRSFFVGVSAENGTQSTAIDGQDVVRWYTRYDRIGRLYIRRNGERVAVTFMPSQNQNQQYLS